MHDGDISRWVGRRETEVGRLDLSAANRLAATVGGDMGAEGDPMPPLAHWCAFTPIVPTHALAMDGHPKLGGFLPPVPLNRRMWAGGALTFHADLHIGAPITRRSEITAVTEKEGAAGPMVFVTVEHELHEGDSLAISEKQDIVYLDIPARFSPPPAKPVPDAPDLVVAVEMSEALLFRYSAATFNAHRIHYDLPYAQQVEKYPGLVVHAPLQATLILQAAMGHAGRAPSTFTFRGVHPMFHTDDLHILGNDTPEGMTLCTGIPGAHQGLQAKVVWTETA